MKYYGLLYTKFKHFIFGKPKMKQEMLLRLALKEKGFDLKKVRIKIDHDLGLNYVNGIQLGIKYPESFYLKSQELIPEKKTYDFYFNGLINSSGMRDVLLEKFKAMPNSLIINSNEGRIKDKKDKFNMSYFSEMANSKFGLCPHQMDWKGNKDKLWTYRFIESCFVEAIPVLFKKTPLGKDFINGFHYIWDDTIESNNKDYLLNISSNAKSNLLLARERFCLSAFECEKIKITLENKNHYEK